MAKTLNQCNNARFRVLEVAGAFLEGGVRYGWGPRLDRRMKEATAPVSTWGQSLNPAGRTPQGLPARSERNPRLHPHPHAPSQGRYLVRVSAPAPSSSCGPGFRFPERALAPGPPAPPSASARLSNPPPCHRLE